MILLVDDDADTLEMYEVGLAAGGFNAIGTRDGTSVAQQVDTVRPDAIVTDLQLQGTTGWGVIESLKQNAVGPPIPVVLLTGYSNPEIDRHAQQLGCAAVLTKPCMPDDLAVVLRRVSGWRLMAEQDVARRWTRVLDALRSRRLKVRRTEAVAASTLDEILVESLEMSERLVQELAGTHLEVQQLRRGLYAGTLSRQHLFEQIPVACLSTDDAGVIQNANQLAAEFLNVSAKHLRGRLLLHFAADRDAFSLLLRALPIDGSRVQAVMRIRPRERSLSKLNAVIVPEKTLDTSSWLWFLTPAAGESSAEPYPSRSWPSPAPSVPPQRDQWIEEGGAPRRCETRGERDGEHRGPREAPREHEARHVHAGDQQDERGPPNRTRIIVSNVLRSESRPRAPGRSAICRDVIPRSTVPGGCANVVVITCCRRVSLAPRGIRVTTLIQNVRGAVKSEPPAGVHRGETSGWA